MNVPSTIRLANSRTSEVFLSATMSFAAFLPLRVFYASWAYLVPLLLAAAIATVVGAFAGRRGWRLGGTLVLTLLTVPVPLVAAGRMERLSVTDLLPEVGGGLAYGFGELYSVNLPADVGARNLALPLLLASLTAAASVALLYRTSLALAPVLPPLVFWLFALSMAADTSATHLSAAGGFVAIGLLTILLRADAADHGAAATSVATRRVRRARLITLGMPTVILVTLLAVLVSPVPLLATGHDRADPRDVIPQALNIDLGITPLARVKAELKERPPRPLFTVDVLSGRPERLIRIAALDAFDGSVWGTSDTFLRAGRLLMPTATIPALEEVRLRIKVHTSDHPFIPVVGWPVRVEQSHSPPHVLGFNNTSGVLVDSRPAAGLEYELISRVRQRDNGLASLDPSREAFLRHATAPNDVPDEIRDSARDLTAEASSAYDELLAVEKHLRALPYRLDAEPGHSYAAVERLLVGNEPGDDQAYAEQHASAFALLARILGHPSRVAVGYRLPTSTNMVTTADAHAWSEVHFPGYGWVAFDPTDPNRRGATLRRPQSDGVAPVQIAPLPTPSVDPSPMTPQRSDGGGIQNIGDSPILRQLVMALLIALGVLILLMPMTIIVVKAWRRRRRRRARSPVEQIVGAWREAVDRCLEHGLRPPACATARELARTASQALPKSSETLPDLALLVTTAVFSGTEPVGEQVWTAWGLERALHRDLHLGRTGLLRRVRSLLDPRPLMPLAKPTLEETRR